MPDHATIARFVVDQEQPLGDLFVEGLRLCAAAGLADLAVVALDGTKLAADASLAETVTLTWIRREVAKLMAVTGEDEQPGAAGARRCPVSSRSLRSPHRAVAWHGCRRRLR